MLDRAGNSHRDVEIGGHHLPGLPDLVVVGDESGVDRGPGGAHRGAQLVGNVLQQREVLAVLHSTSTGNHDPGGGELRTFGLREILTDKRGQTAVAGGLDVLHDCGATFLRDRVERGCPHRNQLDCIGRLHGGNRGAGVDGAYERVRGLDVADVRDRRDIEQRGGSGQDVLAGLRRGDEDVRVLARDTGDQGCEVLGELVGVGGGVRDAHLADAVDLRRGIRHCGAPGAGDQHVHVVV